MKTFLQKYYVLFILTFISSVGLCALSFLTILDYSFDNEEQLILTCNEELVKEIETSLKSGKTLSNYYGISEVLKRATDILSPGSIIVIEDAEHNPIASNMDSQNFSINTERFGVVTQEVHDKNGNIAGTMQTYYDKKMVWNNISGAFVRSIIGILVIFLLIILICYYFDKKKDTDAKLIVRIIVVGIIAQGIFLTADYSPEFEKASQKSVENVASYINSNITSILDKGISISEVDDINDYLDKKQNENSSIKQIYLTNEHSDIIPDKAIVSNIKGSGEDLIIIYDISATYIRQNVFNMVLMFAATMILAVIVMNESLSLSAIIKFRKNNSFNNATKEQFEIIAKEIRYGNFLSVTFDYMCLSFSALQIKEWGVGIFSMSPAATAALSISICSIADIVGMMAMPSLGKKLSGKNLMSASAVILIISNALCFITTSPLIIVIMRFFAGIGTAGVKQSRNYLISHGYSSEAERNANLSASNNGVIGGILCGMGLGGVFAGVFGYQSTFLVSCVGYCLYLVFQIFCIPWKLLSENTPKSFAEDAKGNLLKRILVTFKSLRLWKTVLFIIVPQYFLLMVIVCLIPGRIQSMSYPGVILTYANLLNGITGLYIGELAYQKLIKKFNSDVKAESIILILGAISMIILDVPLAPSLFIILSACLSGLVDGMGTPIATDIFMNQDSILSNLSDTETLMIYSMMGSAVMSIAPFILEACEKNIMIMGATALVIIVLAILYNVHLSFLLRKNNG